MVGKSNSTLVDTTKRGRGRPPKLATVANNEGNSGANPNAGNTAPTKPRRDTFKVYSIHITEDIQAVVIRHGKEIEGIYLKQGDGRYKPMTDSENLMYKMVARAAKSKSSGAKLVGVYYEQSMALLPANLITQPVATKTTE